MLLQGKTIVITGCLKGIGRTTLDLFARHGASIWACAQSCTEEFEQHVAQLRMQYGVVVTPVYFDLTNVDEIKAGMKAIMASKMKIDALINIAGLSHNALFHMTTMDAMKQVFEVNFFSQMLITQYVTKNMFIHKGGSVVFVSSIAGVDGNAGQTSYSASKSALIGAAKTLADELADHGIRVNTIAPGVIDTDMTAALPAEKFDRLIARTKLKRVGTAEEVAGLLVFLASDMSSYVTGQVIRVDGGIG